MLQIVPPDNNRDSVVFEPKDLMRAIDSPATQAFLQVTEVPILITDPEGRFLHASPKFYEYHDVPADTPFTEWSSEMRFFRSDGTTPIPSSQAPLARLIRGEEVSNYAYSVLTKSRELRYRRANGRAIRDANGNVVALVLALHDFTDQQAIESSLAHQAHHDALTSLPNRALLSIRIQQAMNRARRLQTSLGLLFLDIDNFKILNDGLGHSAGDDLLVETAHRLRRAARSTDTVSRLGGDEFVVIAEGLTTEASLLEFAERIRHSVKQPFDADQGQILPTCSIGISIMTEDSTPESLLRDADTAMYRAKESGRDCVQLFTEPLRHDAVRRVAMQREIQDALEHHRIRSFVQPIVDGTTRELVGVEALARCSTASGKLLHPGEFMAIAQDAGLVKQIDEWMLRAASAAVLSWGSYDPRAITLSWNASARLLSTADLATRVSRILDECQFPPSRLRVEVTESALIQATPAMMGQLHDLRDCGVEIGLDDFGTGYSPLTFLRDMPVSFVKIDKSFVERMSVDTGSQAIIDAIIRLAHALGIRVVAEGVETDQQADILQELGCDQLQGYLFARPSEPAEYPPLVAARRDSTSAIPPKESAD